MDDNRHDRAWNDPPLFSLDQMSRATAGQGSQNRRLRYPPQAANQPNPMNPMAGASPQQVGLAYGQRQPMMANDGSGYSEYNPNQGFAASNRPLEASFDINAFMYAIQMCVSSNPNLPQELHMKWHTIQNYLYNTSIDPQTRASLQLLQPLTTCIQNRDLNTARFYCNHLMSDNNQVVRTIGSVVGEILQYFG